MVLLYFADPAAGLINSEIDELDSIIRHLAGEMQIAVMLVEPGVSAVSSWNVWLAADRPDVTIVGRFSTVSVGLNSSLMPGIMLITPSPPVPSVFTTVVVRPGAVTMPSDGCEGGGVMLTLTRHDDAAGPGSVADS